MRNANVLMSGGLLLVGALASTAVGDTIYETDDPFGGPFGLWDRMFAVISRSP